MWNHRLLLQHSFCWDTTEKRKLEKWFMGTRVWAPKLANESPKRPEYVTAYMTTLLCMFRYLRSWASIKWFKTFLCSKVWFVRHGFFFNYNENKHLQLKSSLFLGSEILHDELLWGRGFWFQNNGGFGENEGLIF